MTPGENREHELAPPVFPSPIIPDSAPSETSSKQITLRSRRVPCSFCGKGIERTERGGRPKEYCDPSCRRRAQYRRDRERTTSKAPQGCWQLVTRDLVVRAEQLRAVDVDQLPLSEILELTRRLRQDTDCLAALSVDTVRHLGWSWSEVAAAAGLSEASARAWWGGVRVTRLLAARIPLTAARDTPQSLTRTRDVAQAVRELGAALRTLHTTSGAGLTAVSAVTQLPVAVIDAMLEARRVASWPETYALAHALGGDPRDLRLLWWWARGEPFPTGARSGRAHLAAALRGARLAAGSPPLTMLCPPGVDEAEADAVFAGRAVPDWPVLRNLLVLLGTDAGRYEGLWRTAWATRLAVENGEVWP